MRAPFTQLYVHCVWATWDRLPLVTPHVEQPIYASIRAKGDELRCPILAIGGMPDHVHVLARLHTTVCVADLLKGIKGSSSHLIAQHVAPNEFFKWQGAYGAFTVSKDGVSAVKAYIENQKEHHKQNDLWGEWEETMIEEKES